MTAAGVPVTPGTDGNLADIDEAIVEAARVGYPVMISSNNNYIEAQVNKSEISIHLKDLDGKVVDEYVVGKR